MYNLLIQTIFFFLYYIVLIKNLTSNFTQLLHNYSYTTIHIFHSHLSFISHTTIIIKTSTITCHILFTCHFGTNRRSQYFLRSSTRCKKGRSRSVLSTTLLPQFKLLSVPSLKCESKGDLLLFTLSSSLISTVTE